MTSDVRQQEVRSCGYKRSIYNGEGKTKDRSTLVNTIDNLFCSFIINVGANIASSCHRLARYLNSQKYCSLSIFIRQPGGGGEAN